MIQFDPQTLDQQRLHRLLLGSIAPRPIAFASTVDKNGNPNLSPFSCFNFFGVNPTTLIFSPSRRGRDNTTKHTFENLLEVPEVVINMVSFDIVQQMSLASTEYPKEVNEFIKAGLTPVESEKIRPFRIKESPVQFECKVRQIIETGTGAGAANLIICEIVLMHINENVLDANGEIDVDKIDLVGRLGGDYYVRTSGNSKFAVPKPLQRQGIGIDVLPDKIKYNNYLTGNDLGQLGNIEKLPDTDVLNQIENEFEFMKLADEKQLCELAQQLISEKATEKALGLLMAFLKSQDENLKS
jgi:flavin reductase (DIM6/NTAB) family NADH-FMN oxidoreductase RutF